MEQGLSVEGEVRLEREELTGKGRGLVGRGGASLRPRLRFTLQVVL